MKVLILLAPLGIAACGAADAHVADRVDSAGIEIVTSPGEDLPAPWELVEVGKVGGGLSDTLFEEDPEFLVLDGGSSHFFVLDRTARRIVTLDTLARVVSVFGRSGDGPGEFRFPSSVSAARGDDLTVLDVGRRRLISFSPTGDTRGDQAMPEGYAGGFRLGYLGDALVLEKARRDSTRRSLDLAIVGRGDSGILARYRSPEARSVTFPSCGVSMMEPPLFSPYLSWSAAGDWLAVSATDEYDVSVYHGGSTPRRVRRAIPPRAATEELARQELGEGREMRVGDRRCTIPADEVMEARGIGERIPAIRRVVVDTDGWLRVMRYTIRGEVQKVDVFNPDGEYIGTMTGEHPMPDAVAGSYVAKAIEDTLGLPTIVVSRIEGRDG